jgi:hypothetical protein
LTIVDLKTHEKPDIKKNFLKPEHRIRRRTKLDKIIIAVIALPAVWYLFWQIYSTIKRKNAGCGCGSCAFQCGKEHPDGIMCQSGNTESRVPVSDKALFS